MTISLCTTDNRTPSVKKWLIPQLIVVSLFAWLGAASAAATDLLVAPTRVVFEGRTRTAEITLKNNGTKAATYRVSLVARRMTEDGRFEDVEMPNEREKLAESLIRHAPRRVHLEPGEYQAVRIALRKPANLGEGEYRVHMMFRAVPEAQSLAQQVGGDDDDDERLSIRLIPIYGITIPVIVRHGDLTGGARIVDADFKNSSGEKGLELSLERLGSRSFYSDIEVRRPGDDAPLAALNGVAVYHELKRRKVFVPVRPDYEGPLAGPAVVRIYEVTGHERALVEERRITLG